MKKILLALMFVPSLVMAQRVTVGADRRVGDVPALTTYNTALDVGTLRVGASVVRVDSANTSDQNLYGSYALTVGRASLSVNGNIAVDASNGLKRDVNPLVLPEWGSGATLSLPFTRKTNVFAGGEYTRYSSKVPVTTAQAGLSRDSVLNGTVGVYSQYTSVTNTFRPTTWGDLGVGAYFQGSSYRVYGSTANEYVDQPMRFVRVSKVGVNTEVPVTKNTSLLLNGQLAKWEKTLGVYNVGTGLSIKL